MNKTEQNKLERIEELKKITVLLKERLKIREQELSILISEIPDDSVLNIIKDILIDGATIAELYEYFNKKYSPKNIRDVLNVLNAKHRSDNYQDIYYL